MEQLYLNEFHKLNSLACLSDQEAAALRPLTVEDVLAQSRRHGRTTMRVISSRMVSFRKFLQGQEEMSV